MTILSLNDGQKEAVFHKEGPLLVLSSAGTGKTRVLIERIAVLIESGVSPQNILAITFTNKAAKEIAERLEKKLGRTEITRGTFHSICLQILRKHIHHLGYKNDFIIYDTDDQKSIIKMLLKEMALGNSDMFSPKNMLHFISSQKNLGISPEEYQNTAYNRYQNICGECYSLYKKKLFQNNALDFDDLLEKTLLLLQKFPDVLETLQNTWHYILVDEYQDTNRLQHDIVCLLAQKHKNICVIGDADQSIYSFRGACIENILSFPLFFEGTKIIEVKENYRSTKTIIKAATDVITHNENRFEKEMFTNNEPGEKIQIHECFSAEHEAHTLLEYHHDFKRTFPSYSQVILYRTNAQSRAIEEALLQNGIPYTLVGGLKFYARKEIKDILAFLKLLINPFDTVSFTRVCKAFSTGIGALSIQKILYSAQKKEVSPLDILSHISVSEGLSDRIQKRGNAFITLFTEIQKEELLSEKIYLVLKNTGYLSKILDEKEKLSVQENIEELITVSKRYESQENGLSVFLEEVALFQENDTENKEEISQITLMTVHASKGLEFDIVYICGAEDSLFPHTRAQLSPEENEEERRLFYVALTRARKQVVITYAQERRIFGVPSRNLPSPFLGEISEDCVEYHFLNSPSFIQKRKNDTSYVYDEDSQLLS
jgi:DNA helicase-2/ATP-dependent DNA helicase PcrA